MTDVVKPPIISIEGLDVIVYASIEDFTIDIESLALEGLFEELSSKSSLKDINKVIEIRGIKNYGKLCLSRFWKGSGKGEQFVYQFVLG